MRAIPFKILSLDNLGIPSQAPNDRVAKGARPRDGPSGSGKSTTLAALIDIINSSKPVHIMSIEDPIEFSHAPYRRWAR